MVEIVQRWHVRSYSGCTEACNATLETELTTRDQRTLPAHGFQKKLHAATCYAFERSAMVPVSNGFNGYWLVMTEHLLSVRWWNEACNGGLQDVLKMRLIVPGTSLDTIAEMNGCSRNDSNDPKLTMLRLGNVSLDVAVDRIAKRIRSGFT